MEEFNLQFSTAEQCLKVIADEKWQEGFECRKCGRTNYCQGKTPYQMTCWKFKKRIMECIEHGAGLHLFDIPQKSQV